MTFLKEVLDRLLTAYEESTVTSGLIALGMAGVVIYLAIAQVEIPDTVSMGLAAIITFFFQAKQSRDTIVRLEQKIQALQERIGVE